MSFASARCFFGENVSTAHSLVHPLPPSLPSPSCARPVERAGGRASPRSRGGGTDGRAASTNGAPSRRSPSESRCFHFGRADGRTELCECDRFRTDEVGRWADGAGGRQAGGRNDTKWNNHCTGPSGTQSNAGVRNPLEAIKPCHSNIIAERHLKAIPAIK